MRDNNDDFYKKLRKKIRDWLNTHEGKNYKWADYLMVAPDIFHLLCKVVIDAETPPKEKIKIGAAIAYFVSPIDLMPEAFLGPIGYLDDIAVAAYVLNNVINKTGPEIIERHWAGDEDVIKLIGRILASADEMVGSGLWRKLKKRFSDEEDVSDDKIPVNVLWRRVKKRFSSKQNTGKDYSSVSANTESDQSRKISGHYKNRKYRVEKSSSSIKIYDREDNREVFSYFVDNEPVYTYDRPDWGETGDTVYLCIKSYSLSEDEKYLYLTIADSENPDDKSSCVFEIETGKRLS